MHGARARARRGVGAVDRHTPSAVPEEGVRLGKAMVVLAALFWAPAGPTLQMVVLPKPALNSWAAMSIGVALTEAL